MVRFGRVEGVVASMVLTGDRQLLELTVWLESSDEWRVIRRETLEPLRPITGPDVLAWHADQWTQETIGVDLAADGWEAIGAGDIPEPIDGQPARSATYGVRRL